MCKTTIAWFLLTNRAHFFYFCIIVPAEALESDLSTPHESRPHKRGDRHTKNAQTRLGPYLRIHEGFKPH